MEQNSNNLTPSRNTITEKLRDTAELNKVVKQAVVEAVEKAQRLGFFPPSSTSKKI